MPPTGETAYLRQKLTHAEAVIAELRGVVAELRKQIEAQTPLGRIGQVDDVAPAAVFFASTDSAWITGETLRIAGGLR